MLRSTYSRTCVDHESLQNPVELCLAVAKRLNNMRPRISTLAEPLPRRWRPGIEAHDLQRVVSDPRAHRARAPLSLARTPSALSPRCIEAPWEEGTFTPSPTLVR